MVVWGNSYPVQREYFDAMYFNLLCGLLLKEANLYCYKLLFNAIYLKYSNVVNMHVL